MNQRSKKRIMKFAVSMAILYGLIRLSVLFFPGDKPTPKKVASLTPAQQVARAWTHVKAQMGQAEQAIAGDAYQIADGHDAIGRMGVAITGSRTVAGGTMTWVVARLNPDAGLEAIYSVRPVSHSFCTSSSNLAQLAPKGCPASKLSAVQEARAFVMMQEARDIAKKAFTLAHFGASNQLFETARAKTPEQEWDLITAKSMGYGLGGDLAAEHADWYMVRKHFSYFHDSVTLAPRSATGVMKGARVTFSTSTTRAALAHQLNHDAHYGYSKPARSFLHPSISVTPKSLRSFLAMGSGHGG